MSSGLLMGDLGGTHTRLACTAADGRLGQVSVYRTSGIDDPARLLAGHLSDLDPAATRIRLAVAAPVRDNAATLTNVGLQVSAQALQQALQVHSVELLNDFEAIAYAIPALAPESCRQLGGGTPRGGGDTGNIGILGPGTGLGVAGLIRCGRFWRAIAGEGGHVTAAALSPVQQTVFDHIGAEFGHVSAERLVSGPGLLSVYQRLCELRHAPARLSSPAAVTAAAENDACAAEALDIFIAQLGSTAGNLALTLGAAGGIYIAGGIMPRLNAARYSDRLRGAFENKGRYRTYLASIPLYVVTHPYPGLLGLACLDAVRGPVD